MEHILQFGINIDDERIKQSIYESAEKTIVEQIRSDVEGQLFEESYWPGRRSSEPAPYVKKRIDLVLEQNKDKIIEAAATKLADRVARTKKFRETVDEVIKDNI